MTQPKRLTLFSTLLGVLLAPALLVRPSAADDTSTRALARITEDIRYLAADAMEGRGPGTAGLQQAAERIRDDFKQLGLTSGVPDGSYFQPFTTPADAMPIADQTHLVLRGPSGQMRVLDLGKDYQALIFGGAGKAQGSLVFVGYGIQAQDLKYDDYQGVETEGKILVALRHEPQQADPQSVFSGKKLTPYGYARTKIRQARDHKAAGLLLVNDAYTVAEQHRDLLSPTGGFERRPVNVPTAQLTEAIVDEMLQATPITTEDGKKLTSVAAVEKYIDETGHPVSAALTGWTVEYECAFTKPETQVVNVVGVLEGEGPLANETIVIGAHYDHLGYGGVGSRKAEAIEVHNGADDNASGTSALLELARRYATSGRKPARRLVFIAFSAEERGLIGSNYYCAHPLFALEDTVAMINFDMIGRIRDNTLELYGTGTGTGLAALVEQATKNHSLKVKAIPGIMAASDHLGFYQKHIPSFHFFSGFTDNYHTPEDDFETINCEGVLEVVDFAQDLLTSIAQMPQRPAFQSAPPVQRADRPVVAVAYLGITPDYNATGPGVTITNVTEGAPAGKAGLKAGDVILKIGEIEIKSLTELQQSLRRYKANQIVDVVLRREGQEITSKVTLGRLGGN